MTNHNPTNICNVSLQADKNVIPAGKTGARILEINLTAFGPQQDQPRMPLNLALVLDRSGSMHGEKLHFVKQAAAHVIDLLNEKDRVAVVIYDNQVETLLPSQFATEKIKREAKSKIMSIRTGGSTFLYGGWLAGCREAAETISDQSFNRTLLLTDGLANVGVRDVATISMHAQELFTRNISTSCFGAGADYDEHMLESIANHGGGNFHFLETAQAIPLVFEREFDEIISVALKDVRVTLTLPAHSEAKVSANWHTERTDDQLTIYLGSLVADQTQSLYLKLANLAGSGKGQVEIPIRVTGMDADGVERQFEAVLTLQVVPDGEEAALAQDAALMERFAVVDLADQATEALKRERAGDRRGSARLMQDALAFHQPHVDENTSIKYARMADEMSVGYNAMDRKRRHYQEYQSKRGWQSIRDYRVSFAAGVPIAEIEDKFVLINTASVASIAAEREWLFMDQVYRFQKASRGQTCEQLSQALGTRVDAMFGMDILGGLHVRINASLGVIQFSRRPFQSSGVRLPINRSEGVLTTQLEVDHQWVTLLLISTLKLNYFPGKVLDGLNPVGNAKDGLLGGAGFETSLYKLPITVGRRGLTVNAGRVPDALRTALGLGAKEGVLGADLLQSVPVTLAFPDREMILYV